MRRWTVTALGIAAVLAGCGGGSGSSVGAIPTSVPGNKRISDLTPAEEGQYCMDIAAWAMSGPFLTSGCNVDAWLAAYLQSMTDTAATDADLRTTCSGLYAQCVANGVTSNCDVTGPSTCPATVSEYDACLVETVEIIGTVPGCSAVTRASLGPMINALNTHPLSPRCMTIQAECPSST
jgi:hypothetical protein